jgi:hypothetical protein
MTAESDAGLDGLVEAGQRRAGIHQDPRALAHGRGAAVVLGVRPPLASQGGPISSGEVAEAMGISTDDAAHALHDRRSLGYARKEKRLYEATAEGMQLHARSRVHVAKH